MKKIVELANTIYNTGYIPQEMYKSIFIAIPKKPGAAGRSFIRNYQSNEPNNKSHIESDSK